ncbi:MAG: peptidase T [Lachnospiraceae bacterium]|nr:peptidase T [Lachnospiraceae bacterium]
MRAYERLLQYVTVHTTSSETSGTHPSFTGEFDLAYQLAEEMRGLGLAQITVDEHCYVYGLLPATPGLEGAVPLGFIAQMDTSGAASGKNVVPVLHKDYDGGEIVLPATGAVLSTEQFPFLARMKGDTIITSDGTTLLGADDKAGIAEILTAVEEIREENLPHGPVWICFTPDEEIGEGVLYFDRERFPARFAYTVDGGLAEEMEYENFNAASARVEVTGQSVHPGSAKNTMRNAQNVAMEFHALLPAAERPEYTEGREGFFHLTGMSGSCSRAELQYIIRDHDRARFEARKALMERAAGFLNARYGGDFVKLTLRDSYYNMLEKILPHRHLIDNACEAIRAAGLTPVNVPIRGGTDGAMLSYRGLPCPNLGTGGFNFHGELEGVSVRQMDKAVCIIKNLVGIYRSFRD